MNISSAAEQPCRISHPVRYCHIEWTSCLTSAASDIFWITAAHVLTVLICRTDMPLHIPLVAVRPYRPANQIPRLGLRHPAVDDVYTLLVCIFYQRHRLVCLVAFEPLPAKALYAPVHIDYHRNTDISREAYSVVKLFSMVFAVYQKPSLLISSTRFLPYTSHPRQLGCSRSRKYSGR